MKIYMSVDMEGITGIVHADMMGIGQPEYMRGRKLMTADANAAIEGLVQAGADYILVNDSHGPMRNMLVEEMHSGAHLLTGSGDAKPFGQVEAADSMAFDAAVFIGYHAMAKTSKAIHPHTIAGIAVHELRIDGKPHGETGLNAAVLASLGIPTVMVTGDTTTVAEARDFLGDAIQTVAVKEARGRNAAILRPSSSTIPEITAAAKAAAENRANVNLYLPGEPHTIEVDFMNIMQCDRASRTADVERIGGVTIAIKGSNLWEQYQVLWAALRSALYEPAAWLA